MGHNLPRSTRHAFADLAIWMIGMGLVMGLVFPFAVIVMGIPSRLALRIGFFGGTVSAGAVVGCVNFFVARRVVGEGRRAGERLTAARDAAVELSRAKSEFLATMSHEIRTPMNGVIGLTGLLLNTGLDERQRQYAQGVAGAGEALLAIINDILDFSKIEAGKIDLEIVDFDVVHVVEDVAGLLAGPAQDKGLELVVYCDPAMPPVLRGDPARLRQVLLNLVSNAVKFTETGEVALRARLSAPVAPDSPDGAGLTEGGGLVVRFEVVDSGIGIAAEDRDRLFEPFSQADSSTTRRFGGTGLGLAISRQLVTAMGGGLEVASEIGQGSTFFFAVPLPLGVAAGDRARLGGDAHHALTGRRVLVVDDNDTNRLILHEQLQAWGMRPDLVGDGASALQRLRDASRQDRPFEVVLLDMCMPGMDGLQLARAIAADPAVAPAGLVLLTSAADVDAKTARDAGIGARLTKPVRLSQLHEALRQATVAEPPARAEELRASEQNLPTAVRRGHILVAEDNPTNQMVAIGILDALGYSCDVVSDGVSALAALETAEYAAVLMDCQMPGMDGYAATGEIRRRQGPARHSPVIAMTAAAIEGDRQRCLDAGMDDYISKPVRAEHVEAVLARWVPQPANPAAPDLTDEIVIDQSQLDMLRQLSPNGSLLKEVVDAFLVEIPTNLAALSQAVTDADPAAIGHAAHRLRGGAVSLGANTVAELCSQLEHPDPENPPPATTTLDELRSELARADIVLRGLVAEAGTI